MRLTPSQRFLSDEKPLRFPASLDDLRKRFVVNLRRRVTNDHVLSVDGTNYEVPRGLAGAWTTVYQQVLDGSVSVLSEGRLVRLHPVDLCANAHARRGRSQSPEETAAVPTRSAADMAFDRDFAPVVGPDGGFDPDKE